MVLSDPGCIALAGKGRRRAFEHSFTKAGLSDKVGFSYPWYKLH
jgi:hypothetical protein